MTRAVRVMPLPFSPALSRTGFTLTLSITSIALTLSLTDFALTPSLTGLALALSSPPDEQCLSPHRPCHPSLVISPMRQAFHTPHRHSDVAAAGGTLHQDHTRHHALSVSPQMPPDVHGPGLIKVAYAATWPLPSHRSHTPPRLPIPLTIVISIAPNPFRCTCTSALTSPALSVSPQTPSDAHGPGLIKVTSTWRNWALLRLLLSLMATLQYPPLQN